MTLPSITTGIPISASTGPGEVAEADRAPWANLFNASSTSPTSHTLVVNTAGIVFQAFGLVDPDKLVVQMVAGPNEGDLFQDLWVGAEVSMYDERNMLFLPMPGRYRLRYSGSRLGQFSAFALPVPIVGFPAAGGFFAQFA